MLQKKVEGYRPNYPQKLIRGAALTLVAAASIGAVGCEPALQGATTIAEPPSIVEPTDMPNEDLTETGYIDIDDTEFTGDEDLVLSGDVAIDELTNDN